MKHSRFLRRQARRAARARDWAAAVELYRRLSGRGAADSGDMIQLAHALKEGGDLPSAGKAYELAAERFPHDAEAQLQHGLFLIRQRRDGEAAHALARALALSPMNEVAQSELARLGIEGAALDEEMFQGIAAGYDAHGRKRGLLRTLIMARPVRQARREARARRWDAAARHYRRALQLDPDNVRLLVQLGHTMLEQDRPSEALTAYRRALALGPRVAENFVYVGHALKALGRRDAAAQAYATAWRLQPGLAAARIELESMGYGTPDANSATSYRYNRADAVTLDAAAGVVMPGGLTRRQQAIWVRLAARMTNGN